MNVILKRIQIEDAPKIAVWKSDADLSKLILSKHSPTSLAEARVWVKKNSEDQNQSLLGIYIDGEKTEIIGVSRLMFIDYESLVAEFGFYIGEAKWRGKGFGKRVLRMTLDHAFNDLKLRKVFLRVAHSNHNAIKLYENLGFVQEGILEQHLKTESGFADLVYMSIFDKK